MPILETPKTLEIYGKVINPIMYWDSVKIILYVIFFLIPIILAPHNYHLKLSKYHSQTNSKPLFASYCGVYLRTALPFSIDAKE